jgi:Zn-dependent alcohol dehydrogenase
MRLVGHKIHYLAVSSRTDKANRELHVFRGHQPSPASLVLGYEFTDIVKEAGSRVTTVKVGDKIVSPLLSLARILYDCSSGYD